MSPAFLFQIACALFIIQVSPSLYLQELEADHETLVKISSAGQLMRCSAAIDLLFLLDGSYSIGKGSFERSKHVVIKLCDALDINPDRVRVGVIQYATRPKFEFLLNSYLTKEEVKEEVKRIVYRGGSTQTGLALKYVLHKDFPGGRNSSVPRILVVLTDGRSQGHIIPAATQVRRAGVTVFAVGVKFPRWEELYTLASQPSESHVLFAEHFDDAVNGIYTTLTSLDVCNAIPPACKLESRLCKHKTLETVKEFKGNFMCWKGSKGFNGPFSTLCPYYSWKRVYKTHLSRCYRTTCPDPCDSQPCQYGGTCISDGFETHHCVCPAGFEGDTSCSPLRGLDCSVDLLLLIDGSSATTAAGFLQFKAFVKKFLRAVLTGETPVRVGVGQYSDEVSVVLPVTLHSDVPGVLGQVDLMRFSGGNTKTGHALRWVARFGFQRPAGEGHGDLPHVLVLLTDSESQDEVLEASGYAREREIFLVAVGTRAAKAHLDAVTGSPQRTLTYSTPHSLLAQIPDLRERICSIGSRGCLFQPLDLVFALDASAAVGRENFERLKEFARSAMGQFEINRDVTQVSLVTYAGRPGTVFGLDAFDSGTDLGAAVSGAPFLGGAASAGGALLHVYDSVMSVRRGARAGVNKAVVVLTRGEGTEDAAVPARKLREDGVAVFAVGVGDPPRRSLLRIAGSDSFVITVPSYEELRYFEDLVVHRVCQVAKSPVHLCRPNPCMNGGECLLRNGNYRCDCKGWEGLHCERRVSRPQPRGDSPRFPRHHHHHQRRRRQRKPHRASQRGQRTAGPGRRTRHRN